jgi:hypothetical protein
MVLAVLAPREMVEYGSDPRRPLVADTAFARIFPSRWIAHIPAQSSHLSLARPGAARAGAGPGAFRCRRDPQQPGGVL